MLNSTRKMRQSRDDYTILRNSEIEFLKKRIKLFNYYKNFKFAL